MPYIPVKVNIKMALWFAFYCRFVWDRRNYAALEYQVGNPTVPIDKNLYMEHDENVMNMMIEFIENE